MFAAGTDMEEGQDPGADFVNHAGDHLEKRGRPGCLLAIQ